MMDFASALKIARYVIDYVNVVKSVNKVDT